MLDAHVGTAKAGGLPLRALLLKHFAAFHDKVHVFQNLNIP
jgi:hypothetical protein